MRLKKIFAALLLAAMVVSLSGCDSKLALYIDVQKGDVYKYHTVINNKTEIESNGQKINTVQDMISDYLINVEDVDSEGNISMNYKYDTLKVETESSGAKQSFDSNNPDNSNPMSKVYGSMIGKSFTAKMTKYGEVKEVKGIDELLSSIIDSVDTSVDSNDAENTDAAKKALKDGLKENFGDQAIISMIQQSTKIYPEGNINIGDTWETKYSINAIIQLDITAKYTLDKVEGDTAYVTMKADFSSNGSKPGKLMGMEIKTDINGTMNGQIKINKNNGFLCEGDMTQDMSGKMEIDVPEQGKMEMPMKIDLKMTFNTVKQ